MMPRLQAEEQLRTVESVGLGMGSYEKEDRRAMMQRLRETAFGDQPRSKVRATPAQLGMIGIGVRQAPPKTPLSNV